MTNLIKLLLILSVGQLRAAELYRFGYFDHGNASPLKADAVSQWLRDGLRLSGVKAEKRISLIEISEASTDDQLRELNFLIVRADLASSRSMVERYRGLGGWSVISDRWTREDLGIENLAVLSLALPIEKRMAPLAEWLNRHYVKNARRAAYFTQSDSDFDKIWFYEFLKVPSLKSWEWSEIALSSNKPRIKSTNIKFKLQKILIANRINAELLEVLNAASFSSDVVLGVDPFLEQPSDSVADFFKKNVMVYYMTAYPKGLTDEARDFEREHKNALAVDALLRDALVLTGAAIGKSQFSVNSHSKFYASLDGLRLKGATGEIFVQNGSLSREIFVVGQRGSERVLDWRSGLQK